MHDGVDPVAIGHVIPLAFWSVVSLLVLVGLTRFTRNVGRTGTDSVRGVCPRSSDVAPLLTVTSLVFRYQIRGVCPRSSDVAPSRLRDFTNKRPYRETKHPNIWKEFSKLSPPEPAEVE